MVLYTSTFVKILKSGIMKLKKITEKDESLESFHWDLIAIFVFLPLLFHITPFVGFT